MRSFVAVAAILGAVQGRFKFGACPEPPALVENFDAERYSGTWFEQMRDSAFLYDLVNSQCTTMHFVNSGEQSLDLYFRTWMMFEYAGVDGQLFCEDSTTSATCKSSMPGDANLAPADRYTYMVLDTDYD